ncbi:MAG: hypothetical protein OEY28_11275, partial [Nitrospira sp.]|nr:hypothetical protein [Nitrospira sp.]
LLERMISERPDDHTVNIEMARWLADEGWNDKALERACHAAECAPGKKERAEAQSLLFSLSDPEGEAAFKELTREVFTGDPARVAAELSKTVAAHPELAEGWLFLGFVMRRLGRRRSAAQAFVRCAQLSDDANAHRELGALFGEFGRPRRAALHSKRALELLGGSDRVALLNFAAACCGDGQFEEAAGALARVGELYPDEPGIEVVAEAIALATRPARGFHGAGMGG